jgi:hypothetical protein
MDVYLATRLHHLQALLDLTHHCDIVEKETKTGLAYQQSSYSPRHARSELLLRGVHWRAAAAAMARCRSHPRRPRRPVIEVLRARRFTFDCNPVASIRGMHSGCVPWRPVSKQVLPADHEAQRLELTQAV